jgi:hypothetical protein
MSVMQISLDTVVVNPVAMDDWMETEWWLP